MTLPSVLRRKPRVQCAACGSTRIAGITLGYLDGPLQADDEGRVYVMEGEWVAHDSHDIESGSVNCLNCGGGRYRVSV